MRNEIFGNTIPAGTIKKAQAGREKYAKRFGDDCGKPYHLKAEPNPTIGDKLGVYNMVESSEPLTSLPDKPVIIGNIRMGFGHYRISMAMASAANALGYTPLWLDLNSFSDTTMGKLISSQNELYSKGSRWSEKSRLFNHFIWEPLNSEGFRKLTYNVGDLANAELMTRVFQDIPKDTPYLATHAWPAQAAVAAGMTRVVNAVPDNWPMALHLSPGSIHTVQTHSAWLGYKAMRGMDKHRILRPMPEGKIIYTGRYVDHELLSHLEEDTGRRISRINGREPLRFLLSVGGAGAQRELFAMMIRRLLPYVKRNRAVLFLNVGDHRRVWEELKTEIPELQSAVCHFDDFTETTAFASSLDTAAPEGVHVFCHSDIFAAVYSTNLLMHGTDVLMTKPSEFSFYPVPKLLIRRIGGHEAWGAIASAEMGDGTYELRDAAEIGGMIDLMIREKDVLTEMNGAILNAAHAGEYDGAYRAVKLAVQEK